MSTNESLVYLSLMSLLDNSSLKEICSRADFLDQSCMKLEGVAHVLEALEAPLVGTSSGSLYEVQQLLEQTRRSIQASPRFLQQSVNHLNPWVTGWRI